MNTLNIAVLGGGSWGTTVASLVARNTDVTLWARNAETVEEINSKHSNERYLPGARLSDRLRATNDIGEAVRERACVWTVIADEAVCIEANAGGGWGCASVL